MLKYYIIVILSVFAASCAQMLLKKGASNHYESYWRQYINPWVIGGYMIMGMALLANIFAMSQGVQVKEVSSAESFSYLFVPCLSWLFFRERITWQKVLAIFIIMVGIFIFFI